MPNPTHHASRRDERGFTLVELLVVIAVLAILTAVVVFAVGGITDRGSRAACEGTVDGMRTASQTYQALNGSPAPNLAALIQAELVVVDEDATVAGNVITLGPGRTVTYSSNGRITDGCGA